jgi:hypothetical protein
VEKQYMNDSSDQSLFISEFSLSVSARRFAAFQKTEGGREGLAHYLWNIALCEALYPVFHTLEVALRNAIHREVGTAIGEPDWLLKRHGFLKENEIPSILAAEKSLKKHFKPVDEPRLVAELSFGFWTSLMDIRYDKLWPKFSDQAFPHMPRKIRTRKKLSSMIHPIRKLRNLAFHHHAIWDRSDLWSTYTAANTIIGWISSPLLLSLARIDRFPTVFDAGVKPYLNHAKHLVP